MPPPPPRPPAGAEPDPAAYRPASQATLALGATSDAVAPSPPTLSAVSTAHTAAGLPPGFFEGASGVPSRRQVPGAHPHPPPPASFEPAPPHGVSVEGSVATRASEEPIEPVNGGGDHAGLVAHGSDSAESKEEEAATNDDDDGGGEGGNGGLPPPAPAHQAPPPSTSLPADFYGEDRAPAAVAAAAAAAAAAADADLAALLAAANDDPATAADAAAARADADAAARAEAEGAEAEAAQARLARLRAGVVDAAALAALPALDGAAGGHPPPLVEGGEGGPAKRVRRAVPVGRAGGEVSSSSGSSDSEGEEGEDLDWRRKGVR